MNLEGWGKVQRVECVTGGSRSMGQKQTRFTLETQTPRPFSCVRLAFVAHDAF